MHQRSLRHVNLEVLKRWLIDVPHVNDGGPHFCQNLAEKMREMGMPLWRISYTLTTMHPEVLWRTILWNDTDGVTIVDRPHALAEEDYYQNSPIPSLRANGSPIHVALVGDTMPYPICRDLQEMGGTDYYAQGLPFSWGGNGYISWATKKPGGFDDETIRTLDALIPFLARRIELESSYHAINALLEVYLGPNAARRVIAGAFKRGQGELIHAVIWFCDLRGFTALSDSLAPRQVVKILDTYFDIMANAIAANHGEVLKFIGDAVLAIFPVAQDERTACRNALKSAEEALSALEKFNAVRTGQGNDALAAGIALHIGEVMYGNIGARERLDFTVISSAVNEASRLESLCKDLGTPLTLSERFVEAAGNKEVIDLGPQQLKGVKTPLRVFTLARYRKA